MQLMCIRKKERYFFQFIFYFNLPKISTTAVIIRTTTKIPAIPFPIIASEIKKLFHIRYFPPSQSVQWLSLDFSSFKCSLSFPFYLPDRPILQILAYQLNNQSARDDRSDLPRYIGADRMHQDNISLFLLHRQLLHHA